MKPMVFGKAFSEILEKRRMPLSSLAERAEVGESHLKRVVSGEVDIDDNELHSIAAALGVPVRALFAQSAAELSSIPDFRRNVPEPSLMDSNTIKAISYVEKISLSLAAIGLDLSPSKSLEKYDGPLTKKAAQELAEKWRRKWGISDETQLFWKDANKLYVSFRSFVENLGIFVMHHQFGHSEVAGLYAKVDGGPHCILINTMGSSKARKLFTLAHEFCHVLLRADGISNPSILKNKVEIFCNQFAAHILAPDSVIQSGLRLFRYVPSLTGSMIRLFAKNLGISQQACVLRLVEMGFFEAKAYGQWIGRFAGAVPDGDQSDGPGGGGGDPIQNKRTHYGQSLISKLSLAYKEGILDSIEIYRLAGIKPKYQRELFRS
jgi:Zn-dependent peptidase ImmA (M78 family)